MPWLIVWKVCYIFINTNKYKNIICLNNIEIEIISKDETYLFVHVCNVWV